jgi:hypothetical protein
MLRDLPLAFTEHLDAGAVDQQVHVVACASIATARCLRRRLTVL